MPIRYLKKRSLESRQLVAGDLVVEISGGSPTQSTGRPVLITDELLERLDYPLVCSNFCRRVRLKSDTSSLITYHWLRWHYSNNSFLTYENGTTGIKNFAFSDFSRENYFAVPPEPVLNEANRIIEPLHRKMQLNGIESATLAALRDTLLPRLLAGEVGVSEVESIEGDKL